MSANDHIKQYSAADIQLYLGGKMSPAEMHALEQAALDDPFLADAIEGMQQTLAQHDASVIDAHLQDLQRQVYERTRKQSKQAPVVAFRWWQAAAAAAVIVIIGGIWGYNYFQQTENKEPASQLAVVKQGEKQDSVTPSLAPAQPETTATVADGTIVGLDSPAIAANKTVAVPADKQVTASLATPQKAEANDDVVAYNYTTEEKKLELTTPNARQIFSKDTKPDSALVAYYKDQALRRSNTAKTYQDFQQAKPVDYEQIVIAKQARDTTLAGAYTKPREREMNLSRKELSERQAKKNPNALLSGFIVGRVTDQANNPLSNALLRVNDNRDFFTDHKGNFKIPANDSVVNVAVGVTGYYTQNLQLLNNTYDNYIALNQLGVKAPNPRLNSESTQVVRIRGISSLGAVKSKEEYRNNYPEVRVQDAQPVYGWMAYQQYLEKNRKVPAVSEELTGTVVVTFQVNRKGALSDFKIEQSLGKEYDEEAIRLIKEGPSWQLLKGRKTKATVLVRF
ncbi:energy transducer TonB [Pseudoflavitalea sp. X16]|uniref:energy transducer TonB n=1 Tax=Paraflavitalea devenefica TaxID=2716334 RepID=UPI00141D9DCB|nr:energy transducer TonB [Paraflavitalea devenefica]NII28243.1 energy transducer TonB [Paraflavitalea devenefica]